MNVEIVAVHLGSPLYEELLGQVQTDMALMATMWQEAENDLDEHPDTVWYVAVVDGVAAAWIADADIRVPRSRRPVWLWISVIDTHDLDTDRAWQTYLRRFDLEHTFRLLKQTLGWTDRCCVTLPPPAGPG